MLWTRRTTNLRPVRRILSFWALVGLAAATVGCATYRDDLDRAMAHYNNREYDKALVLLQVLEPDLDSLAPPERAEYAYYRGMSHFLLKQRHHARHWLGRAAAREKIKEGMLRPDEKAKVDDTLNELNKDRWGGASTPAAGSKTCQADADCDKGQFCDAGSCKDAPAAEQPADASPPATGDAAKSCNTDVECPGDKVCADGTCKTP